MQLPTKAKQSCAKCGRYVPQDELKNGWCSRCAPGARTAQAFGEVIPGTVLQTPATVLVERAKTGQPEVDSNDEGQEAMVARVLFERDDLQRELDKAIRMLDTSGRQLEQVNAKNAKLLVDVAKAQAERDELAGELKKAKGAPAS